MKYFLKILSTLFAVSIVASAWPVNGNTIALEEQPLERINILSKETSYRTYKEKFSGMPFPKDILNIDISKYSSSENFVSFEEGVLITGENGYISWKFDIEKAGLYNIAVNYYTGYGKGSSIVRTLMLDGKVPFDEAKNLTFTRRFENKNEISSDNNGNQIRPSQIASPTWLWKDISDSNGYFDEPFSFYLSEGEHVLRLDSVREPLAIKSIKIYGSQEIGLYKEALQKNKNAGVKVTKGEFLQIEGEDATYKSSNTIYPITDNTSPLTSPSSSSKTLLNTIGGEKWKNAGEWVEWEFEVKQSGFYNLGIKARQNINAGQPSYRKIYIDGTIPFKEMLSVKFPYSSQWEMNVIGGNEPSLIYLSKGTHTLKMEVTLGQLSEILESVSNSMAKLNEIYMNFLMVVGPTPDIDRDYFFEKLLPNEIKELKIQSEILMEIYKIYLEINGMNSSQGQQLKNIANQAQKMSEDPNKIAKYLGDFVNNISSLGTWITTVKQQPLEIDYIVIASPDEKLPKTTPGLIANIGFSLSQFIATFYRDYNSISEAGEGIKVWSSAGRDQANALNQLIINEFSEKNPIKVNLELVPANSLLPATMSGKGPDIALGCTQAEPVNYGLRKAVMNLAEFPDIEDISKRFMPSALSPLTFDGNIYGLPETQDFSMLFYRKDILNKLDLSVPKTWDDVIAMLPVLQKKHLNFGLPQPFAANLTGVGLNTYAMFLYQMNGDIYLKDGSKTLLENSEALDAFYKWTELYNSYSLPTSYDFVSRFRTGEIPIGVSSYSTYNTLSVFAPELNGIWQFGLVPGTKQKDGTVNRTVASAVSATVIMQNTKNKEKCWTFIKWWTQASVQEMYGNEIESIMGTAGRYQAANIEALAQIPWPAKDYTLLMQQLENTKGIPEVPGSYMTPRYIDFAFKEAYRSTATKNNDFSEVLINAAEQINAELKEKRDEFGFSN